MSYEVVKNPVNEALRGLVYHSRAVQAFETDELKELLIIARERNRAMAVTGLLVYIKGSFFQFLEGQPENVETVYRRICTDSRHTDITTLMDSTLSKRHFPHWSMGFPTLNPQVVSELEGYCNLGAPDSEDKERLKSHGSHIFDLILAA